MDTKLTDNIRELANRIKKYNEYFNVKFFLESFDFAYKAHQGQKRLSGEDFIWHPVNVASILADYEADEITIIAAILHDVVEDCDVKIEKIEKVFGTEIAKIVDGVTKLGKIHFSSLEEHTIENLRKMFLAMANDIRVIIIKLADRLHNMRTLKYLPEEKQKRIANETLEVYAPLSHRLGMSNIKWEIEDYCFRFMYSEDYQKLKNKIAEKREEREKFIFTFVSEVNKLLKQSGINSNISGRPKHFWSIYNKMRKQRTSIKNLYDLYAIRIVLDQVKDCYEVLGIIHTQFKPIPGKFKDYIAVPKQNMYQSIHTVVIGTGGKPVEVQIRTGYMHKISEFGIAAHWRYKEGRKKEDRFEKRLSWLRELIDWQKDVDNKDFLENLKEDLFTEEIFVFTPKGDVFELPKTATPLDFAYRVHTEIGHRCIGAKVNQEIVNLDIELNNGDIVEVITSNIDKPKMAWLSMVKTSSAKNKIRQWFKKNTNLYDDVKIVEKVEEKKDSQHQDFSSIKVSHQPVSCNNSVIVADAEGVLTYLSKCCNPLPGDEIIGHITKGRGVAIHRKECKNIKVIDPDRLISSNWNCNYNGGFNLALEISAYDRVGLLNDIFAKIAEIKVNIVNGNIKTTSHGKAAVDLQVSISKLSMVNEVINKIKSVRDIYSVARKKQ